MKSHRRLICIAVFTVLLLLFFVFHSVDTWKELGQYADKLWLHRCNSIEKMEEQEKVYKNIEVDLVYRGDGVFDVTHDTDTTFGLHLNPFLEEIAHNNGHIWLDIKNVEKANSHEMCEDLDSLCRLYEVDKEQLIVEGKNWKALGPFTEEDYYTSYYVSYDKPYLLSREEVAHCIDTLQYIADSKKVSALSFPSWWYWRIKRDLDRPIDLLTWKHRTTQWQFLMSPLHETMLNDPQLKVILMKSKGKYHR